jgi:alanine racemase
MNKRTWIEIDQAALDHNCTQVRQCIDKKVALGIVIKSNAYGHGLLCIANFAQKDQRINWLLTAGTSEGVLLRSHGITKPILAMSYIDTPMKDILDYDLEVTASSIFELELLNTQAGKLQKKISVHIKVDTGMSRLGFFPQQVLPILQTASTNYPWLYIHGLFTHLSDTSTFEQTFSLQQVTLFDQLVQDLTTLHILPPLVHALSSGALTLPAKYHYSMVRVGSIMYGFFKSPDHQKRVQQQYPNMYFKPVLTWKTRIISLKKACSGVSVGYNRTYCTDKDRLLAVIPIGYYDGYMRILSNKSSVRVHGIAIPIVGIISMNLISIDVTDCPSIKIGDEVILFDNNPGTTIVDAARLAGTAHNDIVTHISSTIERITV